MSAGLNVGIDESPNRAPRSSPPTPNREPKYRPSMVEVGPDESILHKRRINLHKIGEYSSHRFETTMILRLRSAVEQKKIEERWRNAWGLVGARHRRSEQ